MSLDAPESAALLEDDRFVRGVAWSLLHDEDRAADAAQETWLAAIERPPEQRGGVRAWLATVARNAARLAHRRDRRRAAREERVARREGVPSVADVVEREETRGRVVAAVLALEPASRDVILLRFFEDLPPREVARRLGIPVNTVRSRTRRALDELRRRLDDEHGGDRRRWAIALVPLAGRPRVGVPALIGGLAMAVSMKIALASLGVVAAAALVWTITSDHDGASATPKETAEAPPGQLRPPGLEAAPKQLAGAPPVANPAAPTPSPGASAASAAPLPTAKIRGRVTDAKGEPVGNATVWMDAAMPYHGLARATSAADGTYEIAAADGHHVLHARSAHTATASAEAAVAAGGADAAAPDLVLKPGAVIRGRVLDAKGKPVSAARVKAYATREGLEVIEAGSAGGRLMLNQDDVVTAEDGTFVLEGLEPGEPHRVWLETYMTPDFRGEPAERTGVIAAPPPGGEPIEFRFVPKNVLRGVVLDARTNRPVTRFRVNDGADQRDDAGRFEVPAGVGGDLTFTARGYVPEKVENPTMKEGDRPRDLVVKLAPDPDAGSLIVVVKDDLGNPVPKFRLWAAGPDFSMWEEVAAAPGGEYRATGLSAGHHKGSVQADGHSIGDLDAEIPKAGEARVEVRLARSSAIRLRILDKKGNPAKYVDVTIVDAKGAGPAWRFVYSKIHGTAFVIRNWTVWASPKPSGSSLTEGDGRIEGLAVGKYVMKVKDGDAERDVPFEVLPDKEGALEVKLGE